MKNILFKGTEFKVCLELIKEKQKVYPNESFVIIETMDEELFVMMAKHVHTVMFDSNTERITIVNKDGKTKEYVSCL